MQKYRILSFIIVHILIFFHVIWAENSFFGSFDFQEFFDRFLGEGILNAGSLMVIFAFFFTLLFGRFFCGWLCHFGAVQEFAWWIFDKCGIKPKTINSRLVIFLPLFGFLSSFLPYGISIIVMTIIARLAMSPVTYKSYVSQVKMKILRPEIEQINKKFKDDAIKRQQETMSLYSQAGANPMSGCVPALIQLPVFYGLFVFFPIAFELRQKSFLWADDLSSYDVIVELPFYFPLYGDHISLFPILASGAIFIYTKMTMGQQTMPQQPGMPNMKIIMYLMPLMMLFFFNNYSSGLSLYYFVSNLLTIFLMLVIKNYIIDNDKIHAQIEENKKKPKKASGFTARLQKAMEDAEKQKKSRKRGF